MIARSCLPASAGLLILSSACIVITPVRAQPVLAPNTPSTPAAPKPSVVGESKRGQFFQSLFEASQSRSLPFAKWGPVSVRPHGLYRIIHADGLLNPQQREDDSSVIQTAAAGLLFEIGEKVTFDYTYSHIYHTNIYFRSAADHDARLAVAYSGKRWSLALAQRYTKTSQLLIETGGQTPQDSFVTDLSFALNLGQRTQLSTNVALISREVEGGAIDTQWTTADWLSWTITEYLEYEVSTRLNLGIGFSAGYDSISPGDDMAHTQPQGRIAWRPTDKLAFSVTAGLESREFKGSGGASFDNPVYRASVTYAPLTTTKVGIAGNRSFGASYFSNFASRNSGWTTTLEQRLVKRLYLNADYSDQQTQYLHNGDGPLAGRKDKVQSITARLTTSFLGQGSLSLIYQTGKNSSSAPGFSFNSEQFGAETTYRF